MGLTESNQSKSSFWGPSKSKGTHFPEGVYGGKPRQAVTLPSRPLTRNLNNSATSTDDSALSIINSRPPDLIRYKDRSIYVSARELYSVPPSVQYSKQSEHMIKFSSPSLKLSTSSKNSDLISLNDGSTYSESRNESQNNLHLKKASLSEESLMNETTDNYEFVSKRGRSRSHNYRKRDSSSGSRKACNNCRTSKEKETQTFSESPQFPKEYDYKSERSVIHTQRRAISFKENKNDSTRRSRKSGKRNTEKISCSVPTTPNEIVSDPYICLHYSNNLNQDSIKGYERENHTVTTRCPLYSEACLYIPKKEENLNAISESKAPKRKKSQIIIQLDNKNTNHVDSPYSVTVNKGTYEVCSNVWFESRVNVDEKNYFKNENSAVNLNELSFNDYSKYEGDHPQEVTDDCGSNAFECKSKLTQNTKNVTKCISDSKPKEQCLLNSKIVTEPNYIQPIFNQCLNLSNFTTDDVKTYSTSGYEINYNTDRPDSKDESDIQENSNERRHDKRQNYVENHELRESEISPTYEIENSSKKTIFDCNDLSLNKTLTQMDLAVMKNNKDKIIKDLTCVKQDHIMHTTEPNENNHDQMQELKSVTVSSHSMSISNVTSESVWGDSGFREDELCCDESQDNEFDKNTRSLSGSLINGTFPILRLPKPASQPRLVDVLRRKSDPCEDTSEDLDTKLTKCSLNDQSRSGKYTLCNNILNVTKDENINFNNENATAISPLQNSIHQHCLNTEHKNASESTKKVSLNNIHQMQKMEIFEDCNQQFSNVNKLNTAYNVPSSESVKSKQFSEPILDFKNKTYKERVRRFFSLKLKHVEKTDSKIDCSLMCHEQCQGVVSLDCKMDSPDTDLQFHDAKPHVEEDIPNEEFFPLEDNENPILPNEPNEEMEDCKENIEEENNVDEGEEEKHEDEMLEKEIIFEQEILSQKKQQEVSTLRRTVRRIQSQAVDSAKIEEWVQKCPANNVGLQITKEEDGGYRGCLRIHLNLSRPINIVTGTRPPSIYDILQEERTLEKTLTSFYMPRDIVKAIHITSKTTTREVIVALLRKFKVVDNPQKFALYERTYDTGQSMKAKLRRLSDNECPLVLAIAWNAQDITNRRLVLQENDTADIQWEAFSLPELDNFLRILDREEGEYKNQIRDKYSLLRHRIQIQLSRIAPMKT